jgi:cyclopropane fatty-acyl-phospholipid synthase-like methyltransferase
VESKHEIQNPTSADKIRLLGKRMNLGPNSRVLDMGSGRGGPAVLLASSFGCHVICVEQSEEFLAAARDRVSAADVGDPAAFPVRGRSGEFCAPAKSYRALYGRR